MSASPPPQPAEPGAQQVPTCYRHPGRETYVRCARCDRPICPDCMREASVGFHCVECVAQGNKGVREARTTFGGRVTSRPYVTWTLLGLILLGFLGQQVQPQLTLAFGMHGGSVAYNDQWYRVLTSAFLHGGIMHLLFNGYAMYIVGPQLERWLGHVRFLALWVLSALGGSLLSYVVVPDQLSIGASGAIFGLFGAIFVIGRRLGLDTRFILLLLGINLVITFLVPGIAWTAHIGGLVVGVILAAVYAYLPRGGGQNNHRTQTRTIVHASVSIGVLILMAAGAYVWTLALLG